MINERLRESRRVRLLPRLACWPVICGLALSGCAANAPRTANEPSSYPPWVCGLSHNKDRWQCQREADEPAPTAAPSAQAGKPALARTPPPDPATAPETAAGTQPEPAPEEGDDTPAAAAEEPRKAAGQTVAPTAQAASAVAPQPSASTDRAAAESPLMALPPNHFAIQAGAFANREALREHIAQHDIKPAYVVSLASKNRLLHVVVLQVHDSRRAAEAAMANLSQPLNGMQLWIRSVGSLQNAIRAGDALAGELR